MWPWIRRWRDWAMMHNFWPFHRPAAQPQQALQYSYERAGLRVAGQPIPWSAEAVLVEAVVRLPPGTARRKSDFLLRLSGGQAAAPAEVLRRAESGGEDCYRVGFRLRPPGSTAVAEVLFRDRALGQVELPHLSREQFLRELQLDMPTLAVRLGKETVACQTYVASQCQGLVATAVLHSPTSLAPLLDLDLHVEFRCHRTGAALNVPARLTASQLSGQSALVAVVPRRRPRRMGIWSATWMCGDHVLARQRVRGISQKAFHRSLRICDTRFVVQEDGAACLLCPQAPAPETGARVGPCFLVGSSEPGMAGLCRVQVSAVVPGSVRPPLLTELDVLVGEGPTVVAPGTLDPADLIQVSGFELSVAGEPLGHLSLRPVPMAAFTSEGGFQSAPDFAWTAAAEEEMNERLSRLLEGQLPPAE